MTASEQAGPWNPGIQSPVPAALLHLCTIFRPENIVTSLDAAHELHDLTGIPISELVAFRPQRLALHELLIRITADFAVADGSRIEDLGINFRQIARRLLLQYVEPEMQLMVAGFDQVRQRVAEVTQQALSTLAHSAAARPGPERRCSKLRISHFHSRDNVRCESSSAGPPQDELRSRRLTTLQSG